DQPHLGRAGATALADDQIPEEALVVAPVPRLQALLAAEREHLLAQRVPALGRVEAEHELAILAGPERVLELVAVAPLLDRRHDRLQLEAVEPPDPAQRVLDLFGLDRELALVGQ